MKITQLFFFLLSSLLFTIEVYAQTAGSPLPPGIFGSGRPVKARLRAQGMEDIDQEKINSYSDQTLSLFVQPVDKETHDLFFSYDRRSKEVTNTNLILEDGVNVNNRLQLEEFGVGYTYKASESETWSFTGGFGARSDDLYERSEDNTLRLSLVYVKERKTSKWILGAFYNNNLNLGFNLLPILAYAYQPSKTFTLVTGVPFLNLTWGSFMGHNLFLLATPGGVKSQFNYSFFGPFSIFTGYEWSNENFEHVNRADDNDQFIIEKSTVFFGFRAPVTRKAMLRLVYGYRFDTRYFQAEGAFGYAEEKFSIGDSDYGMLNLSLRI